MDRIKKLNPLLSNKGASLIEVVCSVAILGIIAVAFTSAFSFGSINIFSTGERNKAMAAASSKMEQLYTQNLSSPNVTELESLIGGAALPWNSPQLTQYTPGRNIQFSYMETPQDAAIKGYWFTIVVFYYEGRQHVTLTSFVKKGGGQYF